jgi:hypothetical protein
MGLSINRMIGFGHLGARGAPLYARWRQQADRKRNSVKRRKSFAPPLHHDPFRAAAFGELAHNGAPRAPCDPSVSLEVFSITPSQSRLGERRSRAMAHSEPRLSRNSGTMKPVAEGLPPAFELTEGRSGPVPLSRSGNAMDELRAPSPRRFGLHRGKALDNIDTTRHPACRNSAIRSTAPILFFN